MKTAPLREGSPPISEIVHIFLSAAWRRRYLILVPMLVLPVLGYGLGTLFPGGFETRTTVLVQDPQRFNPFLTEYTVRTNMRDRMDALRALLLSRHVLLPVAEEFGIVGRDSPEAAQTSAVGSLAGALRVQLIGQEMVELRYASPHARGIDRILTRIAERFIEQVRSPEDASLRESVNFLDGQVADAQAALSTAEGALADFRRRHATNLPEQRAANVSRLAVLREQIAEREVRLAGAVAEMNSLSERLQRTDPVLGRIELDLVAARGERALLRARYTGEHSRVQAAERRIERLEEERAEILRAGRERPPMDMSAAWNLASVSVSSDAGQPLLVSQIGTVEAVRARVETLRAELANLQTTESELARGVTDLGEVERGLRGLEREVTVRAEIVTTLRRRQEQARVTAELAAAQAPDRIRVIDRAVEPTAPARPMKIIFLMGGIVGGIVLGIGLATLLELTDGSVRRVREAEKLLGVPVLARIAAA